MQCHSRQSVLACKYTYAHLPCTVHKTAMTVMRAATSSTWQAEAHQQQDTLQQHHLSRTGCAADHVRSRFLTGASQGTQCVGLKDEKRVRNETGHSWCVGPGTCTGTSNSAGALLCRHTSKKTKGCPDMDGGSYQGIRARAGTFCQSNTRGDFFNQCLITMLADRIQTRLRVGHRLCLRRYFKTFLYVHAGAAQDRGLYTVHQQLRSLRPSK